MTELTHSIAKYIVENFGLSHPGVINSTEYKTNFSLQFDDVDQSIQSCMCVYEDNTKLLIAYLDCSFGQQEKEYSLIFKLNENPWIGIHYTNENCLFVFSKDEVNWSPCSIVAQANILAGLELLKNIEFKTEKNNINYVNLFKSIINLYEQTYYDLDEDIEVSSL